jgi:hypothetical protein
MLTVLCLQVRADPRASYLLHCGGCHLPDGSGKPPFVPSLHNSLGKIVTDQNGRDYIVRVPGASQTPMSDKQLSIVLNWVLVEFNSATLPDKFRPLSEKEVANARSRVLADPLKYRKLFWPDY